MVKIANKPSAKAAPAAQVKPAAKAATTKAVNAKPSVAKAPVKTAKLAARQPEPEPEAIDEAEVVEDDQAGYTDEGAEPDPSAVELEAQEGDDQIINMSEIDSSGGNFDVIPRGKYPVIVDESEFSLSKSTRNPMITLRVEIQSGEYENRKLWHRLVLTRDNLGRVKRELEVLGIAAPEDGITFGQLKEWFRSLADSGELIGQEAIAVVKVGEYQGEPRNEIRSLIPSQAMADLEQ